MDIKEVEISIFSEVLNTKILSFTEAGALDNFFSWWVIIKIVGWFPTVSSIRDPANAILEWFTMEQLTFDGMESKMIETICFGIWRYAWEY
mgnify:CR=1 FL=1